MQWAYTIANSGSAAYSVSLVHESVVQQDDTGHIYNSSVSTCFRDRGFGGAFTNPTSLPRANGTTAYVLSCGICSVGPGPQYFILHMNLSGNNLDFRAPVPDDLR